MDPCDYKKSARNPQKRIGCVFLPGAGTVSAGVGTVSLSPTRTVPVQNTGCVLLRGRSSSSPIERSSQPKINFTTISIFTSLVGSFQHADSSSYYDPELVTLRTTSAEATQGPPPLRCAPRPQPLASRFPSSVSL